MKVSQNWLKELVDINTTPEELSEKLSIGGFEVESLSDCSLTVKGIILGKVLSVNKHNNSDKLSICQVDIGNKILQIICGAKNIKSNIYVYTALVGTYLSKIDLTIKSTEIRGVLSDGMICSLEELGLEENSEGIAIIDEQIGNDYKLGTPIAEILNLNDYIYELAITANRPDGMSVLGIAREISALLQTKFYLPEIIQNIELNILKEQKLCDIAINAESIYTVSSLVNISGDKHSPDWLKDRLEKSDIKSINLIVDITNYILLEQGQPLHAFDKNKLDNLIGREAQPKDFGVRKAYEGEKLLALDGNNYNLNKGITVVTCADKPIAIAGVIGGEETSVCNSTKSIWLEAAVFTPTVIRQSSKQIGLRTESSNRYEKGISSRNTINSLNRALTLFQKFYKDIQYDVYSSKIIEEDNKYIKLRRERINKILGPIISNSKNDTNNLNIKKRNLYDFEITNKLSLIGCDIKDKSYGWDVKVLPNRSSDLIREIDLIEEIARLIGYDNFDQNLPVPIKAGIISNKQEAFNNLKNSFINSGFYEVVTSSLVSNDNKNQRIKIANPLLEETSCLRDNLWEEHIKICNQNIKSGKESCWIFESGFIFNNKYENKQKEVLSGAICGGNRFEKWDSSGKLVDLDYYQARGKLREVFASLKIQINDKPTEKFNYLHPGRTSILFIEGKEAGYFGQIHPKYLFDKKISRIIYLFNVEVKLILNSATRKNKWTTIFQKFPTVPKIDRDINIIFNKKYLVNEIIQFIKKSGKNLLEEVSLIDKYKDISIGENNVSYTFRISYRDKEKTLKESEISNLHLDIIKKVENKYKAKLRV